MSILLAFVIFSFIVSFVSYWYGLTNFYPKTTEITYSAIEDLQENLNKVIHPDYGLYDVLGGLFGSILSVFSFIVVDIPKLIAVFVSESIEVLGLVILQSFIDPLTNIIVFSVYLYYILTILSWVNPSFLASNEV